MTEYTLLWETGRKQSAHFNNPIALEKAEKLAENGHVVKVFVNGKYVMTIGEYK